MKTLILKSNRDQFESYFIEKMQTKDCLTVPYYKDIVKNKIIRIIAVIWMQKLNLPFQSLWYGAWKKKIINYDQIIVFDRHWGKGIFDYIHKNYPEKRLICWYWNTIDTRNKRLPQKYKDFVEEWSFDKKDCEKYNFKHNIQFYFLINNKKSDYEQYDAMFVGKDKNRVETVEKIGLFLDKLKMRTYIKIIRDKTSHHLTSRYYTNKVVPYDEIVRIIRKSKCIMDVSQEYQYGLTMRVLEALFFDKKLITTNKNIKFYDFYDPQKIYIFDKEDSDCLDEIYTFLSQKANSYSIEQLKKYSFETWLKNFEKVK